MTSNERLDHEHHDESSDSIRCCSERSPLIDPDQLTRLMSRLSIVPDACDVTSIIDIIDSISIETDSSQAVSRTDHQIESRLEDATPRYSDILSILRSIIQEHNDVSAKEMIQTVNEISNQIAIAESRYTTCDFNKRLRANLVGKASRVGAGRDEVDISVTNKEKPPRVIRENTETERTSENGDREINDGGVDEDATYDSFEARLPSIYANTPLQQDATINELLDLASSMDGTGNGVKLVDERGSSPQSSMPPIQIAPRPASISKQAARTSSSADSQFKSPGKLANRPSSYHKEEFIIVSKRELLDIDAELLARAFKNDMELYGEVLKEPPVQVNSEETAQGYDEDEKSSGRGPMTCNLCGKALKDHICLFVRVPRRILELLKIHLSKRYQDILDSYKQVDLAKSLRAGGHTDTGDRGDDNSVSNDGEVNIGPGGYLI